MALSQEVQDLVAKVRNNTTLVASVDAGIAAMRLQISQLQSQIKDIPVGGLTAEDKSALLSAGNDLDATAVQLQGDIPANVPIPAPAPAAPAAAVPDTHEQDAAAASAATPLAGTAPAPADAPAASTDAPPAS